MNQTLLRIITALGLIGVAGGVAYLGLQYFIILIHIFVLMMQMEAAKLLLKANSPRLIIPFVLQCFSTTIIFNYFPVYFLPFLFLTTALCMAFILILESDKNNEGHLNTIARYTLGVLYVGLLPSLTTKILMLYDGVSWFLMCLVVVFSGDIAAYFIGRKFGKHKLIRSISPNKTWEGAIGGLAASICFGLLLGLYLFPNISPLVLGTSCAAAGILAQSGDFFESLIKRVSNAKDSGILLPGHGGVLDRFDGILFAIPVFYYIAI